MGVGGKLVRIHRLWNNFSLFFLVYMTGISSGQSSKSFLPVLTIPDGNRTCAVDEPSNVVSLMGVGGFADVAQCSMQCTRDADCSGYNLKIDLKLCEIYEYIPTRFALVPGCEHRQMYPVQSEYVLADDLLKVADPSFVESCQHHAVSRYYNCDISIANDPEMTNNHIWLTCPTYVGCSEEGGNEVWTKMFSPSPSSSSSPCWMLVQQNLDDESLEFFNRNWKEYSQGFGDSSGNFWAGNKFLHHMTQVLNSGCRLRVEVKIKSSGEWLWAEYDNMTVESENNNYILHVTGYHGNAGDAFNDDGNARWWQSNGMPFSTPDVDNDQRPGGKCAVDFQCGWWLNWCSSSVLNGKVKRFWDSKSKGKGPTPVCSSRMMIRCN